ncbi:MAG: hypothetical protein IJM30_11645 [Thermoguttaceae bacterium]|nr:hypothetical protein [Thermoguttaceae bacterium]
MENDELLEKNEEVREEVKVEVIDKPPRTIGKVIADIMMTLLGVVSPFLLAFALDPINSTPGLFHVRERYSVFAVLAFIFYFVCIFYWLFRLVLGKKSLREVRFSGWWVFLFIVVVPIGVKFITLFYIVLSGPLVFLAKGLRALMDKF